MNRSVLSTIVTTILASTLACFAQDEPGIDPDLAKDLERLQGSWELMHGNGRSEPTVQSIKVIDGNQETLRRFNAKTGELLREHTVNFKLSKSGSVRVYTFYLEGQSPADGSSYVYKLDKDDFYDIPGLLHGDEYRNYQSVPKIWHWKRLKLEDDTPDTDTDR